MGDVGGVDVELVGFEFYGCVFVGEVGDWCRRVFGGVGGFLLWVGFFVVVDDVDGGNCVGGGDFCVVGVWCEVDVGGECVLNGGVGD